MVNVIGRAKVIVEGTVDTVSLARSGGKIGDTLKKGALVGGAALATLAAAGVETYLAFEEAEAQSRKLAQVLDNMGESKAVPAVEKLADELMRLTGVDDEVIKGGQTILATFSEVAESAGEVGGTFERATKLALDLAASGFGDVSSASKILGKALQDPEKGITALSRAGVTFTQVQKDQIKNFLEANDAASAQNLILKEIEKQVGGTAEASARESQKIATAFGDLKENVGRLVAEMVMSLAGEDGKGGLSGSIYEVSDAVDEFANSASWKQLRGQFRETASLIGKIVGPAEKLAGWFERLEKTSPKLAGALKKVSDPIFILKEILGQAAEYAKTLYEFLPKLGDEPVSIDIPDSPDISQPRSTRASGGPASGWTLVGENGPELARFPTGSYVYPASQTQQMLTTGRDGDTINLNFYGPESLSAARREADWARTYGTRFGSANLAGAR